MLIASRASEEIGADSVLSQEDRKPSDGPVSSGKHSTRKSQTDCHFNGCERLEQGNIEDLIRLRISVYWLVCVVANRPGLIRCEEASESRDCYAVVAAGASASEF